MYILMFVLGALCATVGIFAGPQVMVNLWEVLMNDWLFGAIIQILTCWGIGIGTIILQTIGLIPEICKMVRENPVLAYLVTCGVIANVYVLVGWIFPMLAELASWSWGKFETRFAGLANVIDFATKMLVLGVIVSFVGMGVITLAIVPTTVGAEVRGVTDKLLGWCVVLLVQVGIIVVTSIIWEYHREILRCLRWLTGRFGKPNSPQST